MKIFLDCDDTILNSSECIINLLNKKNNTNKTLNDLKDFNYKSIDKSLTSIKVLNIFESDEFWDNVLFKKEFIQNHSYLKNNFEIEVVSCGTKKNLQKKENFLSLLGYGFNGLLIDENMELCKKSVNMGNGIQIDDNIESLKTTNAAIKILLKNGYEFPWNKIEANINNLYAVNSWCEIIEILDFFKSHPEFVGGY